MKAPLPSPTLTWHNESYPAISPTRPELSVAGKTVVITGAGSGIGRETAKAFASAGAARIVLLGRTQSKLEETAYSLPSSTSCVVHAVDITNAQYLQDAASKVGQWDILILSAAYVSAPVSIIKANPVEWWQSFETNVKGTLLAVTAFAQSANPAHASVIALTTGTTAMPAAMLPGLSAYISSKLALTKMIEFLAVENPNIFAVTAHPGLVESEIFAKSGAKSETLPMDTVQLPAHFLVWLCSPEASFLNRKTVWANWDVEELMSQSSVIQSGMNMTGGIYGWPFVPEI